MFFQGLAGLSPPFPCTPHVQHTPVAAPVRSILLHKARQELHSADSGGGWGCLEKVVEKVVEGRGQKETPNLLYNRTES